MKAIFRVDSSNEIGAGHVVRCITLAHALTSVGIDCEFISRPNPGDLIDYIDNNGFKCHRIPISGFGYNDLSTIRGQKTPVNQNLEWIDIYPTWDALSCVPIIRCEEPAWLIVDHYGIDQRWESIIRPYCRRLMVIDDLANRSHLCELLVDQTPYRTPSAYASLTPPDCKLLCGSDFALIRPEFRSARALKSNSVGPNSIRRILVSMGGIDNSDVTSRVLRALSLCALPTDCLVQVVLGRTSPFRRKVKTEAAELPFNCQVLVGVDNMASLMADSDLAIGAGGTTALERCCVGLPSVCIVLAENQCANASGLERAGAVVSIYGDFRETELVAAIQSLLATPAKLIELSSRAVEMVDGLGVPRVVTAMESILGEI